MAKVNRVGSAFATLPFDGIDSIRNVWLHDDFILAESVADVGADTELSSELTWVVDETTVTTGPATALAIDGVAQHPGILQLSNASADNDAVSMLLGAGVAAETDEGILLDSNGIYIAAIVRIPDVSATSVEFGLVGQAPASPNSSAADVVSFVFDPADTDNTDDELFFAQINSNGTDVEEIFTLPYVENDWVQLEIYATDTDAYFRVTTEDGSETVHLAPAAMPLVAMRPIFTCENVGATAEVLDIDAFHLRYGRAADAVNQTGGLDHLGA